MKVFIVSSAAMFSLLTFSITAFAVLPDDIMLYYNFSAGSGNIVKDYSKYGNDGTITGATKWVKGQHDGAFDLDGRVSVITAQNTKTLSALKVPITVGAIFQVVEFIDKWQSLAGMNGSASSTNNGWFVQFCNQNPTFTTLGIKDHISTKITLEAGKWYYLVYLYDGKNASFYIDSVLEDQISGQGDIDVSKSPMLTMGADQGTIGNYPIHIILDEFWISNVAKTPQDIKAFANPESMYNAVSPIGFLSTTWGKMKNF